MKLDIRFVGVRANEILRDRIYEDIEQRLGDRFRLVDSLRLSIGRNVDTTEENRILGEGLITLKDGTEIQATSESAKLMPLIDRCIENLDLHLRKQEDAEAHVPPFKDFWIPSLVSSN